MHKNLWEKVYAHYFCELNTSISTDKKYTVPHVGFYWWLIVPSFVLYYTTLIIISLRITPYLFQFHSSSQPCGEITVALGVATVDISRTKPL